MVELIGEDMQELSRIVCLQELGGIFKFNCETLFFPTVACVGITLGELCDGHMIFQNE